MQQQYILYLFYCNLNVQHFYNKKLNPNNIYTAKSHNSPLNNTKSQMQAQSKQKIPHVGMDGSVNQLQIYQNNIKNVQIRPFLIQALSSDLDFNTEWMVELDQVYQHKQQQRCFIGSSHVIIGPARCGKFGYTYWRKHKRQKNPDAVHIIKIDCLFNVTPYSFVSQLVQQLAGYLQKSTKNIKKSQMSSDTEQFSKKLIIQDQIRLDLLNNHLKSKPNMKFLLVMKNAQVLLQKKKQTTMYNLLQWIKHQDVKDQIGYVFITRRLDWLDKLQKRIKSRMEPRLIFMTGPRNQKVIKKSIIQRFKYALTKTNEQNLLYYVGKLIDRIEKSAVIQKLIKDQQHQTSCPKKIEFFNTLFSLILALKFDQPTITRCTNSKDFKQFQAIFRQGYLQTREHICPYVQRQNIMLSNMNFPQFITMCYIRKMLIDQKPRITLKQIRKQLATFKQTTYSKHGTSFDFPQKVFQRALKNLKRIRIIEMQHQKDFENAEIYCNMDPDLIKEVIESREDLPQYVKDLLE